MSTANYAHILNYEDIVSVIVLITCHFKRDLNAVCASASGWELLGSSPSKIGHVTGLTNYQFPLIVPAILAIIRQTSSKAETSLHCFEAVISTTNLVKS